MYYALDTCVCVEQYSSRSRENLIDDSDVIQVSALAQEQVRVSAR